MTSILGYAPIDMIGRYLSEFCVEQDREIVENQLRLVNETLKPQSDPVQMTIRMMNSNNPMNVEFKTIAYAFCNPVTKVFEFMDCIHTVNEININENILSENEAITENYDEEGLFGSHSLDLLLTN